MLSSAFLYLPTLRILPIQIEAVEVVLFQECHRVLNEFPSVFSVINQSAVLVPCAVVPPANGQQNLGSLLLFLGYSGVKFCQ